MIKVNVQIENKSWKKKIKNPKRYFERKLKKISKVLNFFKNKNIIFTILLTNSLKMKKLNKKFRKKNKPTDILSFPTYSSKKIPDNLSKSILKYSLYTNSVYIDEAVKSNVIKIEIKKNLQLSLSLRNQKYKINASNKYLINPIVDINETS